MFKLTKLVGVSCFFLCTVVCVNAEEKIYFDNIGECHKDDDEEPVKSAYEFFNGKTDDWESKFIAYRYCKVCHQFYHCMESSGILTEKGWFYAKTVREHIEMMCTGEDLEIFYDHEAKYCRNYIKDIIKEENE